MADTKISALTADSTPGYDSLIATIDDPGGTPASRKTTINELLNASVATANTSLFSPSGYSLTGTDATAAIDIAGTWNTTGTPTAFKLNITDTASNAASLLMDLQVGGTSQFSVGKDGVIYQGDVYLARDAANTLALRNSTNAQTFNIYNTYTDASNYERLAITWNANEIQIKPEAAGTGTLRNLSLESGSNGTYIYIAPNGANYYRFSSANLQLDFSADITGDAKSVAGSGSELQQFAVVESDLYRFDLTYTVSGLPASPADRTIATVTDASAPAIGSTVSGGGAANALVWYNGSNWTVIGV